MTQGVRAGVIKLKSACLIGVVNTLPSTLPARGVAVAIRFPKLRTLAVESSIRLQEPAPSLLCFLSALDEFAIPFAPADKQWRPQRASHTVSKVEKIIEKATADVIGQVRSGALSIKTSVKTTMPPKLTRADATPAMER